MSAKKIGRPKSGLPVRDTEISCSLTAEDAAWLAEFAENLGFRSRSELLTSMLERLYLGGFAPFAFLKLGYQLQRRAAATGASKGAGYFNPLSTWPPLPGEDRPRPKPVLPDEDLAPTEKKQALANIRQQLQAK